MLWPIDGIKILSDKTTALVTRMEPATIGPDDAMMNWSTAWGPTGFAGPSRPESNDYMLGSSDEVAFSHSFGSPGAGGALGIADVGLSLAAAFVPTYYDIGMKCEGTTMVIMKAIGAAALAASKRRSA